MAASFTDQLKDEIKALNEANREIVKVVAIELFGSVINSTPVGNPSLWVYKHPQRGYVDFLTYRNPPPGYTGGTARANWFLTERAPSIQVTESRDKGERTAARVAREIAAKRLTGSLYLTNNLPYIERLEDGWSGQAPAGMVKLNIARIQPMFPQIRDAVYKRRGIGK